MISQNSPYLIHLGPHLVLEVADELGEVESLESVLQGGELGELGQRGGALGHQQQAEAEQ